MAYKHIMSPSPTACLVRDENQIRQRLLRKLGIDCGCSNVRATAASLKRPSGSMTTKTSSTSKSAIRCSIKRSREQLDPLTSRTSTATAFPIQTNNFSSYQEPLKYESTRERPSTIRFKDTVLVKEIPSHRDYDWETRQSIWMGSEEIASNAKRNRLEFMADSFNWRNAAEEKDMYKWEGELLHPATYWLKYQEEQDRIFLEEMQSSIPMDVVMSSSASMKRSKSMTSLSAY